MSMLSRFISPVTRIITFCTKYRVHAPVRALLLVLIFLISCRTAESPAGGDSYDPDSLALLYQPKQADLTPDRASQAERIEKFFNHRNRSHGFNGTVLFAENGEIVFNKAYGYANLRSKDSLHMESAFQLASISKPITALAVLVLYEDGLLSLEDSIQQFIPDFPYHGITIRMLLNHRSGLPNYMYLADEVWPDQEIPLSNQDVVDMLIEHHPDRYYPPNRRYNYSNTNYALLAYLIEQISGIRYGDFVRSRIFNPLRMDNSSVYSKADMLVNENEVIGYTGYRRSADNTYLNGVVGDKGIYASAIDLLRLDQALYNGQPVSFKTLEEAFKPYHKDLYISDNYGLGWRLDLQDTLNPVIYHSGWWKGFKSHFVRETGQNRTMIVLSNTLRGSSFSQRELRSLWNQ